MAANPKFYNTGAVGSLLLTVTHQVITTGQANDSDIVVLSAVNTNSTTAKTITLADASDNTIGLIEIPANAGLAVGNPPIDLMRPGYGMVGLEPNPSGGYNIFLPNAVTIKAKVNSEAGGSVRLYWKRKDF